MKIRDLVKKEVASLTAYQAAGIPCRIKLDANESPYGFSGAAVAATAIKTNRYPDPEAKALRVALAKRLGIDPESILQGNGSDELISCLITTFGGPVLYPAPTFSMYGIIAQALGQKKIGIPLDREFDLDTEKMLAAVRREKPKIVFLSSPNNPTGNCYSSDRMLRIVEASRAIVVVDEAYQPFSSERGFLPLLGDHKNLVIMRTLSKIGLAALRVGFLIADPAIIREVNKVRLPFNVNALSQAAACAALKEWKKLNSSIKTIIAEREKMLKGMEAISQVTAFPSEANFILFRVADPDKVYAELLRHGILVRNMNAVVKGCLRVTVGKPGENAAFLRSLGLIVENKRSR